MVTTSQKNAEEYLEDARENYAHDSAIWKVIYFKVAIGAVYALLSITEAILHLKEK